ncbi:hypothetical protein HPB47_017231 [Ixodes persulcatus]|uniref:Uncharacterized protein n=1 Tax=Ixodes persulcatus TaxID=34615 RepID=A0AC60R040_IXOPE|nr:hypothetical protein HPB47_017231 [Ixodes persulcatus]
MAQAVTTPTAANERADDAESRPCTDPGQNDSGHQVTSTAQYNPTTGKCETIPSETGPHNCQKFATLADCQKNCAKAKQ